MPPPLTLDDFVALIGRSLVSRADAEAASMELVSATPLSMQDFPGRSRDPFALVFAAESADATQGIRTLDLPGHGPVEIFLTPIERDGSRVLYEAIFN